jgi:apolipoprotein N-acyltransferase
MARESASHPTEFSGSPVLPSVERAPLKKYDQHQNEACERPGSFGSGLLAWLCPFLLGLTTSVLLWLSYYPLAWGWLGWIALVPLLALVRTEAPSRRINLAAWIAGLAFFLPSLQWMRVADYRMYYTWIGLSIYCSLYLPVAVFLLRRLDRLASMPLVLSAPVVWTALEFLRAHLMEGFPWYYLAHTQEDFLPVVQIADLGGAYAVSFLLAVVNGLAVEFLATQGWFRRLTRMAGPDKRLPGRQLIGWTALVVVLVGGALGYGFYRLSHEDFVAGPRLALIQGNLDQRVRNEASESELNEAAQTVVKHFRDLTDDAVRQRPVPDLIVWPETSYPKEWVEVSPELSPERIPEEWRRGLDDSLDLVKRATRRWPTNLLLGMSSEVLNAEARPERFNSAVFLKRNGSYDGRYDKIHRVPFGEYVPLREELPWMDSFAPYDFDYSIKPGKELTRFELGKYRFGVLICYEDTDPGLARQYVRRGVSEPPVDFLVNISNDGWFNGTSEHEQHLAICRVRAIECRRAIARAVNMGISAVIDGNGRIVALPGQTWAQSKKVSAVLTAEIPVDHRSSLYAQLGDWLPWTCWLVILASLVWTSLPRRRLTLNQPTIAPVA